MKITVIGTGYVGLVSGVCFAEIGNTVTCVDKIPAKIETLNKGGVPIYEPGLQEIMLRNVEAGRLSFTTDLSGSVPESDLIIIAVGTPPLPSGEADLQYIEAAAREIALSIDGYTVVAVKSTVPVGTNERVNSIIASLTDQPFDTASMPEFLREGSAVKDAFNPDRLVIGVESQQAADLLLELHKPLTENLVVTDIRSAEMIKYASNAFLATKISFINEIANICDKVGADVDQVARGMGMDRRIGASFLNAGIGYGGSCFPKDTHALIQIAGNVEYDFKLLKSVVEVNQSQRWAVIDKLLDSLGTLKDKKIAVWGLAFKPDTDDVREAPSLEIVPKLVEFGALPQVFDPVAADNFRREYNHPAISYASSALEAARDCDAICLLTEWGEFVHIDLAEVEAVMSNPVLIDGRNVYSADRIKATRFDYHSMGRPALLRDNVIVAQ
ncbi:UDP-glucose dehydrogenase family protein [Paenibacillus hunanensis]|uniref:UDP-glucose 6-dehydrogenase n=1 Tax=Paenibacillus hunanensis TaxID=539262 RepID=A0ABU1J344_9BACL|nr:UDP-glucose/GDP-mannose dehydrogenase family protein [Paenibacillus hunanensis]MCL9660780.1 UDP-glucose/GDP-mannose dehydrogenase family protein [Paenibacillus hunanensis]MDR6245913.1 UDPglucose 6-dehydrogenase [Paenibacillus hunanensis]GGJ14464.1 UDP-glucose 6-dehydrogenase TuaD [Paenibacillus hunanensis]